jgi:hypothetical protein
MSRNGSLSDDMKTRTNVVQETLRTGNDRCMMIWIDLYGYINIEATDTVLLQDWLGRSGSLLESWAVRMSTTAPTDTVAGSAATC